jgi:hypothetical protein
MLLEIPLPRVLPDYVLPGYRAINNPCVGGMLSTFVGQAYSLTAAEIVGAG